MKKLHNFKYILFALIVLGIFANFAKNEYGFQIVKYALMTLIIVFLIDTVFYAIKEKSLIPKEKRKRKLTLILGILSIVIVVTSVFIINMKPDWLEIAMAIMAIVFVLSLSILTILLSIYRPMFIESLFLLLYCASLLFLLNRFYRGTQLFMLSTIFLFCYFTASSIVYFRNEKKSNAQAPWFLLVLFLFIILNIVGTLFKTLHLPGSSIMGYLATMLFLFIGVSLIFRKQFSYPSGKISLWRLMGNIKGNFLLLFIFYALAAIYFALSVKNLVPRFYSNARPEGMIQLRSADRGEERFWNYYYAYYDFLDHRMENEAKESKK